MSEVIVIGDLISDRPEDNRGRLGSQGCAGGGGRPSLLSDNARYPGIVRIAYPLHPLFGQEVRAVQLDFKGQKDQLLVERVDYDGQNGSVSITFRPTGIKTLGAELEETEEYAA
jgi:hypothetical protein